MSPPFIDTDIIVRLLTGDDKRKQERAKALFLSVQAGRTTLTAPDTVIADTVFVLASPRLYNKSRQEIYALLRPIVTLPHFKLRNRRIVLRALELYATTALHFGDAMIAASMERSGATDVYSYDQGFDKMHGLNRIEP